MNGWKVFLYFCILCSVVFLTWLSALKHLVAHVAPTLRCFRHLSPSYEWLVKEDSKMCKTQRMKSFGRLSAVGHVLSCHTRRRYFLGHQWILISASVRSSEDSRICSETGLMCLSSDKPTTDRQDEYRAIFIWNG